MNVKDKIEQGLGQMLGKANDNLKNIKSSVQ